MKSSLVLSLLAVCGLAAVSCTPGERGALIGGALGAGTGALIGDGTGALIGGAVGAVAGSEISKNRAARNHGYYQNQGRYHNQQPPRQHRGNYRSGYGSPPPYYGGY